MWFESSCWRLNTEAERGLTGGRETHVPGDLHRQVSAAGCIISLVRKVSHLCSARNPLFRIQKGEVRFGTLQVPRRLCEYVCVYLYVYMCICRYPIQENGPERHCCFRPFEHYYRNSGRSERSALIISTVHMRWSYSLPSPPPGPRAKQGRSRAMSNGPWPSMFPSDPCKCAANNNDLSNSIYNVRPPSPPPFGAGMCRRKG